MLIINMLYIETLSVKMKAIGKSAMKNNTHCIRTQYTFVLISSHHKNRQSFTFPTKQNLRLATHSVRRHYLVSLLQIVL